MCYSVRQECFDNARYTAHYEVVSRRNLLPQEYHE